MKKRTAALVLTILMSILLFSIDASAASTSRLGGNDRFDVAINVSKRGWSTASTVVLANWDAYGDALAASPLAYKYNAPILLTKASELNSRSKQEIQRLKAKSVIIIGGTISVPEKIANELRNMGISVTRIEGKNRVEVANNIANHLGNKGKVVIADGFNFPDALSIAPYAARNGYPILLTNKEKTLEPSTQNLIGKWDINQTIISGGPLSVSDSVFKSVPNPIRFGGNSRFEVSANIAKAYFSSSSNAFVTRGSIFADALTGSVLAAKNNAPILLTEPNALPASIKDYITGSRVGIFTLLGGSISITEKINNELSHPLVGQTIVIDAGHGGGDSGATGNKMQEKEIVLDIAKRVNSKLKSSMANVIMTRQDDTYYTLAERVEIAQKAKADLFVSVHVNSYTDSKANGTETWYDKTHASEESKQLAAVIQQELIKALGTTDRGIKEQSQGFYVIRNTTMPSVLVEIAFISNSSDASKLASDTYRQRAADAIYNGIVKFYN
ncbi:N-acetylmuramoyl-L-alanine amidase [Lederbergia wuyishanensis]|uniref:N-acetylmuramoyl-L-alanine amidase n=1 Tax=Lederbergia wuyishanensis TaxID=1347903 RepID=A0ABU0D381_9BACI|nr:N-acetylmuramoyl-L-alanine amidase [Lederbergia wuyishanensis]MCJ8007966.1 N-acetylmuramoyl-L-alanine amidase [Lederbergia wuyishanensis]MDQ0342864.1 N-acetylmuramoyl-L-alanine amidase [Lederbergia wuyishanensis]